MIESPLIQEMLAQAEQKARRTDIVKALKNRFQTVPPDLIAAVQIVSDEDRLNELFDLATVCPDLNAFHAGMGLK